MYRWVGKSFHQSGTERVYKCNRRSFWWAMKLIGSALVLLTFLIGAAIVQAQEAGGELGGGAGIFRPKNPEAKRSSNPSRSGPRTPRVNPAEIEEKFQDSIADGNDARDARKFAAAESSYRAALKLKPRDSRAFYGLGNVFVDQQRYDDEGIRTPKREFDDSDHPCLSLGEPSSVG